MSQKDGFGNGFILGSIVGGVVGGVLGTLLANRGGKKSESEKSIEPGTQIQFATEESMEMARHNLEDKIAQLNSAIDVVRQQLETVDEDTKDLN